MAGLGQSQPKHFPASGAANEALSQVQHLGCPLKPLCGAALAVPFIDLIMCMVAEEAATSIHRGAVAQTQIPDPG